MSARIRYRGPGRLAIVAVALSLTVGCGQDGNPSADTTPTGGTNGTTTPAPEISAACPLVDMGLISSTFSVQSPKAIEKEPTTIGPVTTYACDLSDGDELFLTVGVSVGPPSGTAEANLRAALSNNEGEPVSGLGEVGGYHEQDGVGTAAGVKAAGSQWRVVFVHGAAGNKEQLITVARSVAPKV